LSTMPFAIPLFSTFYMHFANTNTDTKKTIPLGAVSISYPLALT